MPQVLLVMIFWSWFGYSQLKYYAYIDWRRDGMRECFWCTLEPEADYVGEKTFQRFSTLGACVLLKLMMKFICPGMGGVVASVSLVTLMIPVIALHRKLKREHSELTELDYEMTSYNPVIYNTRDYNNYNNYKY